MEELLRKRKDRQTFEEVFNEDIAQYDFPPSPAPTIKKNEVMYHVYTSELTGKVYSDLTGKFPYRSSRGNAYILIGYHFDGNASLATPTKNRQDRTIKEAW